MRSAAIIAFDFPPVQASSGVLRTLSFARSLADAGWRVSVVTTTKRGLRAADPANNALIPEGCDIVRAFAFDAAKRFSILGKYPSILDVPDRFGSWIPSAVCVALLHFARRRPRIIFSTYPIASAHVVGMTLSRITSAPWVADFRDPMLLPGHPDSPHRVRAHRWIERKAAQYAGAAIFTNDAARERFQELYPDVEKARLHVIENGFDEHIVELAKPRARDLRDEPSGLRIIHNGALYRDHRDPIALFEALNALRQEGRLPAKTRVIFRASGEDGFYRQLIKEHRLEEIVSMEGAVDYVSSYQEITAADGLLLIQGSSCNAQIPAKLYEYFASGRPVIALTDPRGATAQTLHRTGISNIAPLNSAAAIKTLLIRFFDAVRNTSFDGFVATTPVASMSRAHRGRELESVFRTLLEEGSA